ncbi:peptidylprolyl isomerase [candidate division NPL-UPA2 bacterium]|nr:peptidylprolyl isomerase [candidate division NPL-UPA2 bacterium]
MLRILRKKMKGILIATIAIIIPAFTLLYGPGRSQRTAPRTVVVARVNGQRIDYRQFHSAYQEIKRRWQSLYRNRWDEQIERELKKQALEELIRRILLLREARNRRIVVTDQEVSDQIKSIFSNFHKEGRFDKEFYLRVLKYEGLTPERFEEQVRDDLMVRKLISQVTEGVEISEEELKQEYIRRNEEVRVKYILFRKEHFKKDLEVEEKELIDYFQENREEFRVPEKVNVEYVLIDPRERETAVEIKDDEIVSYYQENIEQFKRPEEIRVRHILIRLDPDADEEVQAEAKKKAEEILERLKGGEDFAALAKEYSEDPGSREKGGDLGFFPRGWMVPAFEEAAFSLKLGEVSQLVKTPFGYHIIKLEERREAYTTPLEEVWSEIHDTLKKKRADEIAREEAEDLAIELLDKTDWESMVKEKKETGLFARGEAIKGIGWAPQFSREAFALEEGEVSQVIKTPRGYAIFVLKERKASHLPESLDEVREKVEERVRGRKALELAKSKAEKGLTKLREGATFEEVARDFSLEIKDSGFFSRGQAERYIEGIGPSPDFGEAAFSLTEGEVSDPIETRLGFCLLQLKERRGIDEEKFNEEKEEFRKILLSWKKMEALNNWYQSLRSQADVWTDPEIFK